MAGGDVRLLELAERCEKATGPDRDLNADIIKATLELVDWVTVPDFTSSLDSAMSLVPEGWWAVVDTHGRASLFTDDTPSGCLIAGSRQEMGKAATPALALCAAALRARAA